MLSRTLMPRCCKALDVLTGDTDVNHLDVDAGLGSRLVHGQADGMNGFFDVGHHSAVHTDGFAPPHAKYLEFAVLIPFAGYGHDLGGSDV